MLPAPTHATWPIARIRPGTNSRPPIPERVKELRASIDFHGLLQPIGVIDRDDDNLIYGFQRYFAHLEAPAIQNISVRVYPASTTPTQAALLNAIENLQRTDLTAAQTYQLLKRMIELEPTWKRQDMAHHLGKSPAWVTMMLSPDGVTESLRERFLNGDIPLARIYELSKLPVEEQEGRADQSREEMRQERQKRQRDPNAVRASKIKVPLPSGYVVTVSGAEASLDEGIEALSQAVKAMKAAMANGYSAKTAQRAWSDIAKATG